MTRIIDLPNELLEQIAITYRRLSYVQGQHSNVLLNFSMTCRAFYRVAFRYVYDNLDLAEKECTTARVADLLALIHRNPERGYAVQRLSIGPWDPTEYSPGVSRSESFERSYQLLRRTVDTGSLHHEDVENLRSYPCSVLVTVLFYLLPNIEDLYIVMTSTTKSRPSGTRWLLLALSMAPFPCKDRVRDVELEYISSPDGHHLMPCRLTIGHLLEFPNLEGLRCSEDETLTAGLTETIIGNSLVGTVRDMSLDSEFSAGEEVSYEVAKKHQEFMDYDPTKMDKLLELQGKSSLTEVSFYNNPCALWPIPEILGIAKNLKEFECFIGSRTRDTREHVQAIHKSLLRYKEDVTKITMTYYKGFENRHTPNFQLDFSNFEKLETLQVSIVLLADIEAEIIEMKDLLPPSLETLCLKIRFSTPIPGPHRWDEAVLEVIKDVATYKDRKLEKLKTVDLRVINHPSRPSHSRNLAEARELMKERDIEFKATTYDPYKGEVHTLLHQDAL